MLTQSEIKFLKRDLKRSYELFALYYSKILKKGKGENDQSKSRNINNIS